MPKHPFTNRAPGLPTRLEPVRSGAWPHTSVSRSLNLLPRSAGRNHFRRIRDRPDLGRPYRAVVGNAIQSAHPIQGGFDFKARTRVSRRLLGLLESDPD